MVTKTKTVAKQELNELEREYYNVNVHLKELTTTRDVIRRKILLLFDFLFGKNGKAEFKADNGRMLQKTIVVTETWDEKILEEKLPREQWLAITIEKRVIDESKLEASIRSGKVTLDALAVGKETKETIRLNHKLMGSTTT